MASWVWINIVRILIDSFNKLSDQALALQSESSNYKLGCFRHWRISVPQYYYFVTIIASLMTTENIDIIIFICNC